MPYDEQSAEWSLRLAVHSQPPAAAEHAARIESPPACHSAADSDM